MQDMPDAPPDDAVIDDMTGGMPLDDDALARMMGAGPSAQVASEIRPDVPPIPQPTEPAVPYQPQAQMLPLPSETEEAQAEDGTEDDPPKPMITKEDLDLPDERTQAHLKKKWERIGDLTILPFFDQEQDDTKKIKAYIVRPIQRGQWKALIEDSRAAAANSKRDADEIFMDKLVTAAVVWPQLNEQLLPTTRAGFVPTIAEVVRSLSWFYDPATLLNVSIKL
jgi:hypothetical protein